MASKRKPAQEQSSARSAALPSSSQDTSLVDLEVLRQIVELLETSDVTQLSWRRGDERLMIRRGQPPTTIVQTIPGVARACVQPMTLTAAAIAGLLAVRAPGFNLGFFLLAAVWLVIAHAANNLINDIFDERLGTDTADYPRALYAPHPVVSGITTRGAMIRAALLLNVADLGILVVLLLIPGWPVTV